MTNLRAEDQAAAPHGGEGWLTASLGAPSHGVPPLTPSVPGPGLLGGVAWQLAGVNRGRGREVLLLLPLQIPTNPSQHGLLPQWSDPAVRLLKEMMDHYPNQD